jgi:hypothetical protein
MKLTVKHVITHTDVVHIWRTFVPERASGLEKRRRKIDAQGGEEKEEVARGPNIMLGARHINDQPSATSSSLED